MGALLVSDGGQKLGGEHKNLALIDTTKLSIAIEVLFVECLQQGIEQAREARRIALLHNICSSLLRIAFRNEGCQAVHVHRVLVRRLVRCAAHKLEAIDRHADGEQHLLDDLFVIDRAMCEQLFRRLEIVEVGMQIGKQNGHLAAGTQEISDLGHRYKVRNVRRTRRRRAPVQLEWPLFHDGSHRLIRFDH